MGRRIEKLGNIALLPTRGLESNYVPAQGPYDPLSVEHRVILKKCPWNEESKG